MFIVLDLETTGLSPKDDAIIELAFIKIDRKSFQEIERFSTFINPEREIPEFISQITNIFDTDVVDAPKFDDIRDNIEDFIEGYPLIGHNISFDLRFLDAYGINLSKNPPIDTFFLANFLCYQEKSLNLWYLCEVFDIPLDNAHRAIDDTIATVKLFQKLIEKLQSVSYKYGIFLWYYFSTSRDTGIRILRDEYLISPNENISQDDIVDTYTQKLKKNIYDIQDMSQNNEHINIEDFLDNIPWFELRDSQKKMLDKVDNTFKKWKKSLIEAPTGIGKTFAYLLPAIYYSLQFWEAVHISTSTKALQDQIYYKDLHFLEKHFPLNFSFTKLKGKRNYLGVSSFLEFLEDPSYTTSLHISFILKILLWSMETEFWELDELDFYGEEYSFLSDIHAWNSFIFDDANPYKDVEFSLRARKRAKSANIIITNNHILFQDMVSEGSLLGWVKNLVLDEAHALEDVVTQSLKKTLSFLQMQKLFQKLEKKQQKYKDTQEDILLQKEQILFDTAELFSLLEGAIFEKFSLDAKYKSLLLKEKFFSENTHIVLLAKKISDNLEIVRQKILWWEHKISLHFARELQEISSIRQNLSEIFFDTDFLSNIYYITHDENRWTQLHNTVLRAWDFLKSQLWNSLKSVVLTSATLQMGDDFAYVKNVLQLEGFDTLVLPSDFDYSSQALLFIPEDLGSVKNNITQIVDFLEIFFTTVKWRTLVLFTAFFAIREVFTHLKISLEKQDIYLLAQSISGSKHKQIDFFKKRPEKSILLWTDTFWEGIDIPGEDLKYLIIHKIPFSVPSDPIFQARSALFKDSFWEYAIPKSILKLKQWFWRLIRTKKDTGMVVFLDDRISKTSWWARFFEAFPQDIKIRHGKTQKLIEILQHNQ